MSFPLRPLTDFRALSLSPRTCLIIFCLFQLTLWTMGPWVIRFNPVYDTMESFVWGNQWQWGYDKHPPFTAWMTALFGKLTSPPDLGLYFLAQLSIVVTFLAVWRLAKEYLDELNAILAVIMLTGILHYSNLSERVTPDTMQSPLWALLALSFYLAVNQQSLRYWLLTGLLTGMAILTKYQVAVLLLPMGIALIVSEQGLATLKSSGPWLAAGLALLIASPHLIWLYQHNFPAFHYLNASYVSDPAASMDDWSSRLLVPLDFAQSCLGNTALLALLCWPLFKCPKKTHPHNKPTNKPRFKQTYLFAIALGPTLVTLIIGAFYAQELVHRWSTPYFAWLPLGLLFLLCRDVNRSVFNKILIRSLVLMAILCSLRMGYLYYKPYKSDDYWRADEYTPAAESMAKAEQLWSQHYDTPLPYLGGAHYHVMALVSRASGNTIPFSNLEIRNSLWMSEADFKKHGGIIVLERNSNDFQETAIKKKYPGAHFLGTFEFRPHIPKNIKDIQHSVIDYYLVVPQKREAIKIL